MKVVYFSSPAFFDYDISLINHLRKYHQIYFILNLPPFFLKSTAINIDTQIPYSGIVSSDKYLELKQFEKYIDKDRFYVINRTSKKSYSLSNLKLQFSIKNLVDKINPDLIHFGFHIDFNFIYLLIVNKRKSLLTVHDPFPHSGVLSRKSNFFVKVNYMFFKNVLLLNSSQRDDFKNKFRNFGFRNIFQSRLGVYEYLLDFKKKKSQKENFSFLFFGRIESYKGVQDLLIAFNKLNKVNSDIELIIAGKGVFDFGVSKYKTNRNIVFVNRFIPNKELACLIWNSDLVVCPYRDATQSGVLMSAFALEKAVLATDIGGFSETIISDYNGFLVPPNNIDALEKKMDQIIQSPKMIKTVEANIRKENLIGEWSWNSISKDMDKVYVDILKNN